MTSPFDGHWVLLARKSFHSLSQHLLPHQGLYPCLAKLPPPKGRGDILLGVGRRGTSDIVPEAVSSRGSPAHHPHHSPISAWHWVGGVAPVTYFTRLGDFLSPITLGRKGVCSCVLEVEVVWGVHQVQCLSLMGVEKPRVPALRADTVERCVWGGRGEQGADLVVSALFPSLPQLLH